MKKQKDCNWYNNAYKKLVEYNKQPEKSGYYPIWFQAMSWINEDAKILDLGCGPGQFAKLLHKNGKNYVLGVDFSEVAIEKAKDNNPLLNFIVGDLHDNDAYDCEYDVVLLFEVLEHIENDILVLNKIKKDKVVIFSVPSFDAESHVRFFADLKSVLERYRDYIDIIKHKTIKASSGKKAKIFLVYGIKK
ncbi:MAG: class I SAM-dependent methyltransferase [Phenylobacterium sp.]